MDTEKETKSDETIEDSKTDETSTPTTDERLALIEEELQKAKSLAEEKDKGFRTLQQKYDRLYKARTVDEPDSTVSTINKKIVDELDRQRNPNYADDPQSQERIQALKIELAKAEAEESRKAQLRKQESMANEAKESLEDKIREAGFEPEDEKFDTVWDKWDLARLADGKFERAEEKLTRILSRAKPKEETVEEKKPVETEEQMRERLEREILEERGLTKPEKVRTTGVAKNEQEALLAYNRGELPFADLPETVKKRLQRV